RRAALNASPISRITTATRESVRDRPCRSTPEAPPPKAGYPARRMTTPAVAVESLTKSFGATAAVDALSFEVAPGEIYGLLGPNGAGKTTTLRVLAGILLPTRGRVRVVGLDVEQEPLAVRQRLGFLTNTTGLYPRLTGRELLAYFARVHALAANAAAARVAALADALQLTPFFDRRCEALSTGERQRVSIARAVL